MLKQQCLGLGMRDSDVDLRYAFHQSFGFSAGNLQAKIARKTFFQVLGFSDIDNSLFGVIHTIDAGLTGDGFEEFF